MDLIPLKYGYGHNMSQMTRVYQRPKVDKQRVDAKGVHEYMCKIEDYSIKYEGMFNCKFSFKYWGEYNFCQSLTSMLHGVQLMSFRTIGKAHKPNINRLTCDTVFYTVI